MYVRRTVEESMLSLSRSFPCLVVYGPRQVGKSTTVSHLFSESFHTVTLDDIEDRALAIDNPRLFLEMNPWPLVIDEIQKAPNLLEEIKATIDAQRLKWLESGDERRLMYVLTGSNQFELQQGVSESLAGRCGIVDMASFSQAEAAGETGALFHPGIEGLLERERVLSGRYCTRPQVFGEIFRGGMPDVVTGVSEREAYFKSYVSTYIERDVRKLVAAGNELAFRNFLTLVALRTAQELRYDALAGAVGVDARTCKRWISILETSGIVYLLHPYMPNASRRIIKAPKLYFMDTGLCAFLCKWPDARMLEAGAMGGAFFETYVVSEIVKSFYGHNEDPKGTLFYYRDTDQREVDLVYAERGELYPIEIKKGDSPKKPTRNFRALAKYEQRIKPGLVIDTCDRIRPVGGNAFSYPVSLLGM